MERIKENQEGLFHSSQEDVLHGISRFFLLFSIICFGSCGWDAGGDEITLRQSFRRDLEVHPEKTKLYLQSPDAEIRRYALYRIAREKGAAAKETLKLYIRDADKQVRLTALTALLHFSGKDPDVQKLLAEVASTDKSREVSRLASDSSWPFHRNVILLRNNPNWDHDVVVVKKIPIPDVNWKFKLDLFRTGHLPKFKWYQEDMNEKGWKSIRLGNWEKQGYDYDGIAWYRIRFTMPEKINCNAVELAFGGVDESAWVWLNGTYLGCHDIGPDGWNIPFSLDCTEEVRWGKENVMVVRVLDTRFAGGIYKPVHIEILK